MTEKGESTKDRGDGGTREKKQEENSKQGILFTEERARGKRVTFRGVEKQESKSLSEMIREAKEELHEEVRELREGWNAKWESLEERERGIEITK